MSKRQKQDCPGAYEVSGYTTDSGKKVDSYIRRCWKHGEGGNINIVSDKEGNLSEGTIYEKSNSGEKLSGSGFVSESDDFDNVIINLNEGENPFPNTIFQMTNPGDLLDSGPIEQPNGNSDGNWGEIVLGALLSLGTVAGSAYLSYLMNRKEGKTNFSSVNLQKVSGGDNFAQTTYKNFELSKFDPKKTETDIKNSTKNIENILKQKEVSNNDISVIRSSLRNSVGSICNDIESISYRRSQQPEIPTVESMEAGKTIEKDKKQTIDNATNVITSINLAQNALKKNFDSVSMNSPEYNKKLYEYVRQSDELKKMSNSVMDLFQEAKSPTKNSINTINKIRQDLGFDVSNIPTSAYNGTTGSAADMGTSTGFAASIEEEKRKYKTDDPTAQRVFKIIEDIDSKIDTMNEDLNKLNNVKTPVTKLQVLQKLETLKTLLEVIRKFYPYAEKIDKNNKNGLRFRKDTLIYWFDRVINKLPKTINNTNRLIEKYAYYNADKIENVKKLKEDMYETERIFPENLKSKITLFAKISARIIYLINRIIDNINYRRNPDLKEIEEIDPKYGKKPKMSEENEAIYDYALEHPYDKNKRTELREFLINEENFRPFVYDDWGDNNHELQPGDKIIGTKTIGYGFTILNGKSIQIGTRITKNEADKILETLIDENQRYIDMLVKVPLTQKQYDMLVSIIYNKGYGNFVNSNIYKFIQQGDYIKTSEEIIQDGIEHHVKDRRQREYQNFIFDFPK